MIYGDVILVIKSRYVNKFVSLYSVMLMVFISMNIIIFSAPVVSAEGGGSPEIYVDELGFSKDELLALKRAKVV